jgi:glycosyltransferase involved in cell wall biosynthesis
MKVGITTFGCDGGKSGMSQYLIYLLRALATLETDAQCEVLVYEDEKEIFAADLPGVKVFVVGDRFRGPIGNIIWHQLSLPGLCRRRGYDILFLPAGNRRISIFAPCPTVGTVHDFANLHIADKYDPARMFYQGRVLPWMVRRLSRVITISQSSKKDIVGHADYPEERITVIPHGVDTDLYFPHADTQAFGRIADKYALKLPYILYIARIEHPGKNHIRLIQAFDRLKKADGIPHQLVLAGSDWSRADEVHRFAEQVGCSGDIRFTGFAPVEDLPTLYRGADLYVLPSLFEGFGMTLLEAMACETPVACADISSMPEVVGDTGVLFDPYDEEAIAASIRPLLLDVTLRQAYAAKGLQRSRRFTWQAAAEQTLETLKIAAAGK